MDKHLHILLQKEVIPTLIQVFPRIQFILSTHSTFVNLGLTDMIGDKCTVFDLDNPSIVTLVFLISCLVTRLLIEYICYRMNCSCFSMWQ